MVYGWGSYSGRWEHLEERDREVGFCGAAAAKAASGQVGGLPGFGFALILGIRHFCDETFYEYMRFFFQQVHARSR